MKKKVLVLGATGMLGSTVAKYFLANPMYVVDCSYRSTRPWFVPVERSFRFDATADDLGLSECDYIINCIGLIKQIKSSREEFYKINAEFPKKLVRHSHNIGAKVLHITTDCVFSGSRGNYAESDKHDASDDYGTSKSAGECQGCMNIRTSIIGPEMAGHLGLFEFVRGAKDTIKGFVNHRWNGMTTLQYAKVCDRIMNDGLWVDGVRHVFSNSVSKYELVSTIDDVFGFDKNIIVHEAAERIDRTLSSSFDLCSKMTIPSVEDQLREIAEQASHDAE